MPVLGDLYELLLKQAEPEAQNIATALEIYVNGSLNVFNHRSNIDMNNHRVLCFQLKSLGKALKEIGCRVEPCYRQPLEAQDDLVLYRRIPSPFERADRKFQRGDMETVQEMGRHTERPDAECERPAGLP